MSLVNLSIQIIPKTDPTQTYAVIDKAIEAIAATGVKYRVCPFETVMEGTLEQVYDAAEKAQQACFQAGATEVLVFTKLQRRKNGDVTMEEKTGKYEREK